jgi:DNA-binding CsgD family transcriptional regulator
VVDDAHELPPDTVDHIDTLLSEEPDRLHLLMLARWDLMLTRLVPELLGHLTVVRGGVLRMDRGEVESLVAHHARTRDEVVVDAVVRLAQGWCAVAVLASKSVGSDRDPRAAAGRLLEGHTSAADRIMTEALAALTPAERHLLLCVAGEPQVTPATALHLSRDDGARRTLDDLVSTGLLVTKHETLDSSGRPLGRPDEASFEVHPLLKEAVQRRVRAGGADVLRAREAVLHAVRDDVARGESSTAFRRLVSMGAGDDVLELLAERGVELAVAGHLRGLGRFVRYSGPALEARPSTCLAVGLERWFVGDVRAARTWWERAVRAQRGRAPQDEVGAEQPSLARACATILLARTGDVGLDEALVEATAALSGVNARARTADHALVQLLRLETGIAQLRRGLLPEAERTLASVVSHADTERDPLVVAATAQLAVAQFLAGRERTCVDLAATALRDLREGRGGPVTVMARQAVDAARGLALVERLVGPSRLAVDETGVDGLSRVSHQDLVVDSLLQLLQAHALLLRGAVARAEQVLTVGTALEELPDPVVRRVVLEHALLALVSSDWPRMAELRNLLSARGSTAEASLVGGLRADGMGDLAEANVLYTAAATLRPTLQPPTEAIALVCRAQLLDADGRHEEALEELAAAVSATQYRRSGLPFVGWSRHGTPVATLLRRLSHRTGDAWARQLAADTAEAGQGVMASAAIATPRPRERAQVPHDVPRPSLSPRERDVLLELARGSTYADIAANLYVSQNTVKTHVSSLYSKLAVSRRSDALAVARTLGLL